MTDNENREVDQEEIDGVLLEEPPGADAGAAPPPGPPDIDEQPAIAAEHGADSLPAEEPAGEHGAEPEAGHVAGNETGEEGHEPAVAAAVPVQQLGGRVEALERQVDAAADRARLLSRVEALRKRVDEAATEDHDALVERLERLAALCQEHLGENLRRKEEMVAQAEALADSTEWKSTAEAVKVLQAAWKTVGPVPVDRSQDLWQRFRKAGNTFFERLHEHRKEAGKSFTENLVRKEELCGKAEELSLSTDWKAAAEAIKALQAEWKAIGPAPREQADAVWKRFRKAADLFFERRKEHSDKLRKEQEENLRRKETLVVRADELSQSTQWKATVQLIKELQTEWRTIGPAPSNKAEGVWRRFRGAIDLFFERQSAYFAQRGQDVEKHQDQMLDALERKREQANRVRESIDRDDENLRRWQSQLAAVETGEPGEAAERSEEIRAGLAAKISDVEGKLPAKRQRLDELEAAIQEIAAKLT